MRQTRPVLRLFPLFCALFFPVAFSFVISMVFLVFWRARGPVNRLYFFRTPAVHLVAPAGVLASLGLMIGLPLDTWVRFVVWLVIGFVIHGCYGVRHSRLARTGAAASSTSRLSTV